MNMTVLEVGISNLQLKPGDTLVVRTDRLYNDEQYQKLLSHVQAVLPDDARALILPPGITLEVLEGGGGSKV